MICKWSVWDHEGGLQCVSRMSLVTIAHWNYSWCSWYLACLKKYWKTQHPPTLLSTEGCFSSIGIQIEIFIIFVIILLMLFIVGISDEAPLSKSVFSEIPSAIWNDIVISAKTHLKVNKYVWTITNNFVPSTAPVHNPAPKMARVTGKLLVRLLESAV